MFLKFYYIIEFIYDRLVKIRRPGNPSPAIVTVFDYILERAPSETVTPNIVVFSQDQGDLLINDFYNDAESVEFWGDMIGCATSGVHEEWIEWDFTPEGEMYPISYDPQGMPFSDAFQIAVDLMNTLEKGAPDYINDIFILNAAYMYAVLSAASKDVRDDFYKYLLEEDEEFAYLNYDMLFNHHLAAMDMEYVMI